MSTSYTMNIAAYVATVILAAVRLAAGGSLTEMEALLPALAVLGILVIVLASNGGFRKSTYRTGPAFCLAWSVLYVLLPAKLSLRGSTVGSALRYGFRAMGDCITDNLAVFSIGLVLLVALCAVYKHFPNGVLNVLRYAILILLQLLLFRTILSGLLGRNQAEQVWAFIPPILYSGMCLAYELEDDGRKSHLLKCALGSLLYGVLLLITLSAVSSGQSAVLSRMGQLTHMEWPALTGAVMLAALTLEKGVKKQGTYRTARLLVWVAYILLLRWRTEAMDLNADDCWLISLLAPMFACTVYEELMRRKKLALKWYHPLLALLALLSLSMAALQDMRFVLMLAALSVLCWICVRLGTLAGHYKVVMRCFWGVAAMLLLAASRQLGARGAIPADWLVTLAVLAASWCVLTVFLTERYRVSRSTKIYSDEYTKVCGICDFVPLLTAALTALCVIF